MAISIVLIAFSSATQDIIIDAFRIESAPEKKQGPLASMYLAGYRVAMIVSGAGSLWLASHFSGSAYQLEVWKNVYQIISLFMLIGLISTFFAKEPLMLKKNNIKNFEQIKFTVSTVSSIVIFFIVYLSIPAINELNYFFSFLLNLVKI